MNLYRLKPRGGKNYKAPPRFFLFMEVLTKTELELRKEELLQKIKHGKVFIHPTDTIYGLSCDATNEKAVEKLRRIKERYDNPFSVWAPSPEWIRKNCEINQEAEAWLKKLPGPYTLILKLKNKKAIAKGVNLEKETLGVRMPNHWFSAAVKEFSQPLITTSANKAGKPFMTSLEDLDRAIIPEIEFLIYEGKKEAHPSKIIDLVTGDVKER